MNRSLIPPAFTLNTLNPGGFGMEPPCGFGGSGNCKLQLNAIGNVAAMSVSWETPVSNLSTDDFARYADFLEQNSSFQSRFFRSPALDAWCT